MLALIWWHVKNPQWLGWKGLSMFHAPNFKLAVSQLSWEGQKHLNSIDLNHWKKTQTQNISPDLMKSVFFLILFFSLLFKLSCCQDFCQAMCFWNKISSGCLLCMFTSQYIWEKNPWQNKTKKPPKQSKLHIPIVLRHLFCSSQMYQFMLKCIFKANVILDFLQGGAN